MLRKDIEINLTKNNDIKHTQSSYLNLIELLLKEEKLDSAYLSLKYLNKSLDTIGTPKDKADWNKLMWSCYEKKKNVPKAHYYLQQYLIKKDNWLINKAPTKNVNLKKQYDLFEHKHNLEILQTENKLKNLYLIITIITVIMVFIFLIFIWFNWK
jgi:hypothetical protein